MTRIQWTQNDDGSDGKTWNPTVGCMKVSAGCKACYAINTAYRLDRAFKQPAYAGLTRKLPDGSVNWTGTVRTLPERLELPLTWRKPTRVFVDSMSDLFHEDVPDKFIAAVFGIMAATPRHSYQVLTKRPSRMLKWFDWISKQSQFRSDWIAWVTEAEQKCGEPVGSRHATLAVSERAAVLAYAKQAVEHDVPYYVNQEWPLPNVWLGVSVEDQRAANERIPLLLQTPAAVRFLSCEPLLGPVWLKQRGWLDEPRILHWVIGGGESGAKARLCDPEWARSLRDQCQAAGVPFFWKQWGGRTHAAGGRLLDDREWNEFPEASREAVYTR